jgi:uncharacterized OB-fold protein
VHTRPQPGVPVGNPDSKPFWDGCARNELLLQRCTACGIVRHPPSPVCTNCLSDAHEWFAAGGNATVYTYTIVRQALARGWDERLPYVVAVVELDEGPKFLTNIVNVDPETVTIGMPVEVTFAELDGMTKLPNFQPRSQRELRSVVS